MPGIPESEEDLIDPRTDLQGWLERDEAGSRPYRAKRLQVLLEALKVTHDGFGLYGGMCSAQAFAEMRLAFIHGLFLSTVLLALACIEQELAGMLHAAGHDDAARARLETLVLTARELDILTDDQVHTVNRLRQIRNAYAHFREWSESTSWLNRALTEGKAIEEVLEADAINAMEILGSFIGRRMGYST